MPLFGWIVLASSAAAAPWFLQSVARQDRPGAATSQPAVRLRAAAPANASAEDRTELERRFRDDLRGVTLRGTWQMTQFGDGGAKPLGEARSESYAISSAEKDTDDYWIISARIQFGDKDVTLPVRVRVVWAGDTPVITLDDLDLPLLGRYSARVMIYRDFYSGTWFGAGYGGVMSGQIVRAAAAGAAPQSGPARP